MGGQTFLGVPMARARNVLREWRRAGDGNATEICAMDGVGLEAPVVAALLQEFEDRGLIDPLGAPRRRRPALAGAVDDLPPDTPILPIHARHARSVDLDLDRNTRLGIFPADDNRYFHVVQARFAGVAWAATRAEEVTLNYEPNKTAKSLAKAGLDGRARTAVLMAPFTGGSLSEAVAGILMERIIGEAEDEVSYRVSLDVRAEREIPYFRMANALLPALALASADIVRILRRDRDRGVQRRVEATFESSGVASDLVDDLIQEAVSRPGQWLGATYRSDPDLVSARVGENQVLGADADAPRP